MNDIEISHKYAPLLGSTFATRYYVIDGGRGSSKSFSVALILANMMRTAKHVIWFSRYTMKNIKDSIIPEFLEKPQLLGVDSEYYVTKTDIKHKVTESVMAFRGIKTSEGIQTANLKGPKNMNVFVVDEAEEFTDEKTFDTVDDSIRTTEAPNIVILIFNAPFRKHWIYRRFYRDAGVPENFNGVKGNVTYIHMSYVDNIKNLSQSFLDKIRETKRTNIQKYNEEYLGHWKDDPAGLAFPRAGLLRYQVLNADVQPDAVVCYVDVADQGSDYLCAVFASVVGRHIYIIDVIYTQSGHAVTIPLIVAKFRKHKVGRAIFESNNQGYIFGSNVRALCESEHVNTVVQLLKNSTNKETRIISNMDYINENFQFLSDTEIGHDSEYDRYLNDLSSWTLDGRFNPDDAPDATAGLAKMVQFL
jgi:PBSX family phage terminase large subunit